MAKIELPTKEKPERCPKCGSGKFRASGDQIVSIEEVWEDGEIQDTQVVDWGESKGKWLARCSNCGHDWEF